MVLSDIWSIDEITIFRRPLDYTLQFSYTTGCNTNTPSRVQVEYFSSSTNCLWRPIERLVAPSSCNDLTTTYLRSPQLTASTWTRVTLPLPPEAFTASTQFRWTGQEDCPTCTFSLDDVYVRPGCPNNCNNQGICTNGECSCNTGYSDPACLPTSVLRELREDFSGYPLSSMSWSSVTGNNGNLNSRCGRLTGLYSLSFSGPDIRELVTNDIDTTNAYYIEFVFRLGGDDTICLTPSNPSESVILQYSIDGGASWDNLAILCYSQFLTATQVSYELSPQSQTRATRFRWWQPTHSGSRLDEWAITDLFIGGNLAQNSIFETFDPINNDNWLFYSGANITEHCSSQRNALLFSRDGHLSTRDFYVTSNHVIQFDLNLLACDCGPPLQNFSHIQLEYSVDRGNSWRLLSTDSVFSPSMYRQWNRVIFPIPEVVANQTLRLQWIQPSTGYSCWAVDNINISTFCLDCVAPPLNELYDDFANPGLTNSLWQTPFQYGMVASNLCDRPNVLQFSTVGRPSYAITRPLNLASSTSTMAFVQFDLVIDCNANSVGTQHVYLQYSTDGSDWHQMQEECLDPNNCDSYTLGTVYYSSMYTTWRRVLVPIPASLYDSPFELRFISNSSDSFDWAVDNVYIGSGCSLQCVQHGSCVNGTCRCDDGYSSLQCQPTVSVPSFKEDFEFTLQSSRWPVVTGGSIVPSSVASGKALIFNQAGLRYIESRDMDLSEATFIQLSVQLNISVIVDKAIYIEYSIDGGLSWITITRMYYSSAKRNTDTPSTLNIFELPTDARTESTRIHLWQLGALQENDAVWGLDDIYMGGATEAPLNVESDFATSLSPDMWPSHAGGMTGASYCGRNGVLVFNSSSSGLHHLSTTFLDLSGGLNLIQFEINVGCGTNTGTMGAVSLEFYYLDSDMSWSPVIDRCDANGQCDQSHEETIYYSVNHGQWTRVSVVINEEMSSRDKSFRWNQGYYTSDDVSNPSWALSNVYIGQSNSCPNFCSGNGMCTIDGCQCDPGYAPPMCLPSTATPTSLTDDFTDSTIDTTKWSEIYGGNIGTICSLDSNGNSLYFNQPGIRKAVTTDLDMSIARMLSFQINIGVTSANCATPQNVNEGVLLQYSINGGVTWTTIMAIDYNDNSADTKTVTIPDEAKTTYTRFRWWQRFNPGLNMAQWSLDNVRINYEPVVLDGFFEDFESDAQTIANYDGSIESYCTSKGKGLVLNGAVGTSAVTELVRFSNTILTLQFRMATSCNNNANGGGSNVILETSDDDGATWQQAVSLCNNVDEDGDPRCLNTRFFMPSIWGWENRAGWYKYTVSLARLPTSGGLGRLRWRKLNGEILSLDDIYVGQECIKQCSLHGDCRNGVCMCDDGYDGDDCSVITNKDNMITDIIDNFEGSYVSEKTWMQISGGVIEDTCPSTPLRGTSLHFNGEGIRLATTKPFDASKIEEFSFMFYYGDDCTQTKTGSQVSVAISKDFGISWDVIKTLGAETTQGSINVAVGKDMRMKDTMLGWFQFQHGDGTVDSWTIDDVNITLSLDSSSSSNEGSDTDSSSSSSSSTWIYGVIAGVVIVVIVGLIILAIVIVKMRSRKETYEFNVNPPTKSLMQTEFQNPVYGETLGASNKAYHNEENNCNDS